MESKLNKKWILNPFWFYLILPQTGRLMALYYLALAQTIDAVYQNLTIHTAPPTFFFDISPKICCNAV